MGAGGSGRRDLDSHEEQQEEKVICDRRALRHCLKERPGLSRGMCVKGFRVTWWASTLRGVGLGQDAGRRCRKAMEQGDAGSREGQAHGGTGGDRRHQGPALNANRVRKDELAAPRGSRTLSPKPRESRTLSPKPRDSRTSRTMGQQNQRLKVVLSILFRVPYYPLPHHPRSSFPYTSTPHLPAAKARQNIAHEPLDRLKCRISGGGGPILRNVIHQRPVAHQHLCVWAGHA